MPASSVPTARPRSGPACLVAGFALLARPGLRRFVILPLAGNLILLLLAAFSVVGGIDAALAAWVPEPAGWLRWLLYPLAVAAVLVIGLLAFSVLANLLLGPFLGLLAARVIDLLEGPAPPRGEGFLRELVRDAGMELRRLGYILLCTAGVMLLGLIPGLGLLAAPLGLVVAAWLLALESAAHPLGLYRMPLPAQLAFLRRHRTAALGFGLAALAALTVPLLNLLLLPAAVCGMSCFVVERLPSGSEAV